MPDKFAICRCFISGTTVGLGIFSTFLTRQLCPPSGWKSALGIFGVNHLANCIKFGANTNHFGFCISHFYKIRANGHCSSKVSQWPGSPVLAINAHLSAVFRSGFRLKGGGSLWVSVLVCVHCHNFLHTSECVRNEHVTILMYWVYYKTTVFYKEDFFPAANTFLLIPGVNPPASENRNLVLSGSDVCRSSPRGLRWDLVRNAAFFSGMSPVLCSEFYFCQLLTWNGPQPTPSWLSVLLRKMKSGSLGPQATGQGGDIGWEAVGHRRAWAPAYSSGWVGSVFTVWPWEVT